jgi:hypothetical protein
MNDQVTLCITMGRRPQLLRKTLSTLLANARFDQVIAINDFRDAESNHVFQSICPEGRLISLNRQLGHHAAVDYMYKCISTPWVFHCEDDWLFQKPLDLDRLVGILKANSWMSGICMRQRADFELSLQDAKKVIFEHHDGLDFYRLDPVHDQWHGYTFNPHLASVDLWRAIGPFSGFRKERHISRHIRKQGRAMPYLVNGGCSHLGADDSVSYPVAAQKSFLKRWLGL